MSSIPLPLFSEDYFRQRYEEQEAELMREIEIRKYSETQRDKVRDYVNDARDTLVG